MKRCSIIVHSVRGNCYILGSYMQELLKERGIDARLYRVKDEDLHIWANREDTTNEFYEEIFNLPTISEQQLFKSDMIILGSPTRFGNVTGEMKDFLDSTYEMSKECELANTLFACFTSCSNSTNEGVHTLDNMVYWAQCQRMIHIPLGVVTGAGSENQPAGGIVHLAGENGAIRPSEQLGAVMAYYADLIADALGV